MLHPFALSIKLKLTTYKENALKIEQPDQRAAHLFIKITKGL